MRIETACGLLMAFASVSAACFAGRQDDGFRSRLASGCNTKEACTVLERDAHNRYASCEAKGRGSCKDLLDDRREARRLQSDQRRQEETERDARISQHHAAMAAESDERSRLFAIGKQLDGGCSDKAQVERAIEAIPGGLPSERRELMVTGFRKMAAEKRDDRFHRVAAKIQAAIGRQINVETLAEVSSPLPVITEVREQLGSLQCEGQEPTAGTDKVTASVEAWAASLEKSAETERQCRATPECMANRAAAPVCQALLEKRLHTEELAKERRNPAGVVNLTYLHQLGQALQDDDERIGKLKADYASATHKPFVEARCAKTR